MSHMCPNPETGEVGWPSVMTPGIMIHHPSIFSCDGSQVSVVLCATETLNGALQNPVFLQEMWFARWRVAALYRWFSRNRVWIEWWWCIYCLFLLLPFALFCIPLFFHLAVCGLWYLDDDCRVLFEVLAAGRLGAHDGFGAVHSGWWFTVQLTVGLFPASELREAFFLYVSLGHGQFNDLRERWYAFDSSF